MLLPSTQYFTLSPAMLLNSGDSENATIDEKVNLNILVNDPALFSPALFEKAGLMKNDYILSLSYEYLSDERLLKNLLPKIYLLSSLNISSEKCKILPVFFEGDCYAKTEITEVITSYFYDQGVQNLKLPFFNRSDIKNGIQASGNCYYIIYPHAPQENLNNLFLNTETSENIQSLIIIDFENQVCDKVSFSKMVNQFETGLYNNFSFLAGYLSENYIEKPKFESEKKLWRERTELYQKFISLSKEVREKEYYEVVEWYTNEYEILPLWYKRFGHILKVLMGKRTFRSLFSDRVKKYKT